MRCVALKTADQVTYAPRIRAALTELEDTICRRYPTATFTISHGLGDDSDGIYLCATVALEDLTPVVELYSDRVVDMRVEEGGPVHVKPIRPPERIAVLSDAHRTRGSGNGPSA